MPLTTTSGMLAALGKLEYQLSGPLRRHFTEAVEHGSSALGCAWDVQRTSRDLAGHHVLWRARDLMLDGVSDRRASEMFHVSGREHLDQAISQGRGCLVLTAHFGAHMLPAHWLFRQEYPLRLYMERPRSISKYMSRRFAGDGPHSQDKLFISRKGDSTEGASSILRASRVLKAGMLLFLAGDVRWSGKLTEEARFLGRTMRFSSTWVVLASMTSAPVVPVTCHIGEDHKFHLEFGPAYQVPRDVEASGHVGDWVQGFLTLVEEQVRLHPSNSNDYLFWPEEERVA